MADVNLFQGGNVEENDSPTIRVRYPKNYVQTTSAGHVLEMNNTKDGERIRLLNANGNFLDLDEKKNTTLKSYNDTYILSDHNLVIKVGTDVETDRVVLQVIGDVNLYVEGDMHTEVEGNRYDQINGNWEMKCGGVMYVRAEENMALSSKNQMKLSSNSYENKTTFLLNDLSEGGSIKENVKGNYEVKIQKESSTFSIKSDGDVRIGAANCRYEKVGGNFMTDVGGKVRTKISGGSFSCINGGAFEGMISAPASAGYDINVSGEMKTATSGNYVVAAGGNIDMNASAIYLN